LWLPAYLEWSSQSLRYDQLVEETRQTKTKTKERLAALHEASSLVLRELGAPVRDFLEIEPLGPIRNISALNVGLMDLAKRAEFAAASPFISQTDGATKAGRNKAMAPGRFSAKTLCAARIVDAFVHFRGSEPGCRRCGRGVLACVGRPVEKFRKPSDRLASPLRNNQGQRENTRLGKTAGCLATRPQASRTEGKALMVHRDILPCRKAV
jgi:hypothetical protein